MPVISTSDLTWNGEEIKSISEALFIGGFQKPAINEFHSIANGIVAKKQIAILGRINGYLGKGSNACGETDATNTVTNSEKFWDPATVSDRLPFCWTELKETFFVWGLKKGIEKGDLTSTDLLIYLEELVQDAIVETAYRLAYFGDKDHATVTDSPAGVLTTGTDLAYFNKINGFFKQLFAIAVADASRLTTGLASRNGQATYALQKFTSTDTTNFVVTNTLQDMLYEADERLRGASDLVYIVTQSVADQYSRELTKANQAFTTERLENGITMLKSGGIEVYGFSFLDRIIKQSFDNGTKYYLPHRAILTTKSNLQVGTEEVGSLADTDVWFDKTANKTYLKFAFNIDAKVLIDHLVQVAY
jgi:hypothetical protein